MCLFTHFAAGALAGAATGNPWAAAAAGLASHAVLDMIPHWDHPDWRVELSAGLGALVLLLLTPFATAPAVVGGVLGMVPDLENLFQKLGWMGRGRFIFPSHTGLLRHGRTLGPRSIVGQIAIFIGCFLALGLVTPDSAAAADRSGNAAAVVLERPTVEVLQADEDRTVLRLTVPVGQEPADWSAVDPRRCVWPRAGWTGEAGRENEAPRWSVAVAVPTRSRPEIRVLGLRWHREPDDAAAAALPVTGGTPALQRGVPIGGVEVDLAAGGGILREIILEIGHRPDAYGRGLLDQARTAAALPGAGAVAALTPAGLANSALHGRLALGARARAAAFAAASDGAAKDDAGTLFSATGHWLKLTVPATGLHRVTGVDLVTWGVPTTAVDPAKLRLYRGGGLQLLANPEATDDEQPRRVGLNEVAIEVTGAADGEFNLGDELRFYGVATSAWQDRFGDAEDRLQHYDHPAAGAAVYWLTWENDATPSPLPGAPRRIGATAAVPAGGPVQTWGQVRLHREEQSAEDPGLVADGFTWDKTTSTRSYAFTLRNPVAGAAVRFCAEVRAAYWTASYAAEAWLNSDGASLSRAEFTSTTQQDSLRVRVIGTSTSGLDGANALWLRNALTGDGQRLALDSFGIMAACTLDAGDGGGEVAFGLWGDDVAAPGAVTDLKVAAARPGDLLLWDVTRPDSAFACTGAAGTDGVTYGLVRDPGQDRHFVAVQTGDLLSVAAGELAEPVDLRAAGAAVDYIVVAPAGFMDAAGDLAAYRSFDLPGIASPAARAVLVDDIYDNFSGGQKDPLAIRNYLRWVYTQGGGRLGWVCLLGKASRDPRNWRGKTPYVDLVDLVPADLRTEFPNNPVYPNAMPFATDDGLVSFDLPPANPWDLRDYDIPDVACGRLPAVTVTEARGLVERAIAYAREPAAGAWRNQVLLAADDANRPGYSRPIKGIEPRHTTQAEDLAERFVATSVDVTKIFAVDYPFPPGQGTKPQVQAAIKAALSAGTTMFYYVGHGADDNLADEQIFRSGDIPSLTNGMKRFVFLAFSCDVGVYDSLVRRSMAEEFVTAEGGGAIGAVCASQVSFVSSNEFLSDAFFAALFPGRRIDAANSLGQALLAAKGAMSSIGDRDNSQRYNLFGDPATKLPYPVDDLAFAAASMDTLATGRRHLAVAETGAVGAGEAYDLLVQDSQQAGVFTCYDYYLDPETEELVYVNPTDYTWWRQGAAVFRGSGTAGEPLTVPFKAPLQLGRGERGRVRLVASGPDGDRAVVRTVPVVSGGTGLSNDVVGPAVRLAFEGGLTRVQPGTQLEAALADTSGIAMMGTSPGNSILLEFDDTGFMTNVTDGFSYDPDSYTTGRLAFALPADLEAGRHTVALYAADALGNVGSDTLSFALVSAGAADIAAVTLFPNPTAGPCRLVFELSDPMTVRWDIYTVAGRLVRSQQTRFADAGPAVLEWDGRDAEGDELANGTYLYVLRGLDAARDGRDLTRTGKLVVMR